jgi:hydrogenase maturation factor
MNEDVLKRLMEEKCSVTAEEMYKRFVARAQAAQAAKAVKAVRAEPEPAPVRGLEYAVKLNSMKLGEEWDSCDNSVYKRVLGGWLCNWSGSTTFIPETGGSNDREES